MTTTTTTRPGSMALDVGCPLCHQPEGETCRTTSGRERRLGMEHRDRWDAVRDSYRRPRRYVLIDDDPRFRLRAGDVLVCEPYRYDGEKRTVLYRERDGFDPQCNVYKTDVRPVRGSAGVVDQVRQAAR